MEKKWYEDWIDITYLGDKGEITQNLLIKYVSFGDDTALGVKDENGLTFEILEEDICNAVTKDGLALDRDGLFDYFLQGHPDEQE